jgi:hypothetical protein
LFSKNASIPSSSSSSSNPAKALTFGATGGDSMSSGAVSQSQLPDLFCRNGKKEYIRKIVGKSTTIEIMHH